MLLDPGEALPEFPKVPVRNEIVAHAQALRADGPVVCAIRGHGLHHAHQRRDGMRGEFIRRLTL
jgi:hypothetical protein